MVTPDHWPEATRPLIRRVALWIENSLIGGHNEALETLAFDIYEYQCMFSDIAKALYRGPVSKLEHIPAIPVQLYKELNIGTVPAHRAGVTFLTSGTTGDKRGAHHMHHASLYEHAAISWARAFTPNLPRTGVHLLLNPQTCPESSLSHMVDVLCDQGSSWHLADGRIDTTSFMNAIRAQTTPVFVGATAFALAQFVDQQPPGIFPDGTVLMVTGGFKGHSVSVSDQDLYRIAQERYPNITLLTEYGMTELSSQLWGHPNQPYRPPPWMKIWPCDPVSGHPCPAGTVGQLRFFDLANVDSALVIETMDQGMVDEYGHVHLFGRISNSDQRGCSLTAEAGLPEGHGP